MATKTPNLGLSKPAGTDLVDINVLNGNMDILDKVVGESKGGEEWIKVFDNSTEKQVHYTDKELKPYVSWKSEKVVVSNDIRVINYGLLDNGAVAYNTSIMKGEYPTLGKTYVKFRLIGGSPPEITFSINNSGSTYFQSRYNTAIKVYVKK